MTPTSNSDQTWRPGQTGADAGPGRRVVPTHYRCVNGHGTFRREDLPTRYGQVQCGPCMRTGYVDQLVACKPPRAETLAAAIRDAMDGGRG